MKKLAALMIVLSLGSFTVGCSGGGSSEDVGAGETPPPGEPSAGPIVPEGEEAAPEG